MSSLSETREEGLDKFYTLPIISNKCIESVKRIFDWNKWDMIIEPSAGNGSFLKQMSHPNIIGIDILPENDFIIKQDFLLYYPPTEFKNILIIGNPPFGRVCSTAIKFFNHSSKFANVIAFIIPKTFRRISIQNRLNLNFHLIYDEDIPDKPCSFEPKMSVKCCFQIWEKRDTKRDVIDLDTIHDDWDFLKFGPSDENGQPTPPLDADFAIRAYGGKCGVIEKENLNNLRPKSWHWIKSNIPINQLIDRFQQLDYSLSLNTARQNSIGRAELVKLYKDKYN
jgi:hypothetical protein